MGFTISNMAKLGATSAMAGIGLSGGSGSGLSGLDKGLSGGIKSSGKLGGDMASGLISGSKMGDSKDMASIAKGLFSNSSSGMKIGGGTNMMSGSLLSKGV